MNVAKRKGTAWETAVVGFFKANGFPNAERRALSGVLDRGDIAGFPMVVECKATQRIDLGVFMAEAEREAKNAKDTDHLLVIKRRQRSVADAYAVMPLWLAAELVRYREDDLSAAARDATDWSVLS